MSKYKPLSDRLTGHADAEWRASFSELEEVLGFPLPKGARAGKAWWANDGDKGHSKSWTSRGWNVGEIDPATGYVTFQRTEAPRVTPEAVQPQAMKKASEKLSRSSAFRDVAPAAIVAGVAVVAGLATFMARKVLRKAA